MDVTTVLQQLHQSGDSWDAVQDELLLRALQSLRDGILRQAEDTEKQLLASSQRAEAVGLKLRAANCHLEVLAQSQFLEHRIQTEEDEVDPTCLTEDLWSSCQVEPVPEVELDAIKKALSLGQNFVENQVIDEMPPLPPVIGSEAWQNSFITNVEDFLGETETPAVAASPATEEVEEEAVDLPDETADWGEAEATPSFAPTSLAPEPPKLASQLNALLTRRGGPVEGDGQGNAEEASDPLGLAPPLGGAPKAKGKGKGKSKSTAKPTGSLFDEGPTEVKKPQAATSSPGASLFDEPPIQAAASPAKTGSSLFDDDAPAPLAQASPAKMGSLFDDEPLPKAAKAPTAKTAPATKGKGKSAPSLFDEGPQAKAAPKAAPKPTIAASLFDDEPPAQKPPAKAQASASSLFGEDPLFNDAPAKPGPKRDSGPLKVGGGGSIFDDDATRTAPSGEGLGLLATLAPRPPRQEPLGPEASSSKGEPKVEAQEPSKPAGLFGDEVHPNPLFGTAASTAASSPNRKSRLDSLDADVPVAAAPAAKASAGPSLFGGSGRLARNIFDDDDDVVKQDGSSKVSSLFGAAMPTMPTVPPAKAPAERDAPGVPKATAAEPSKPAGGLFGDNEVRSNPLFGTAASAPSTRKPRLDSNEEDAPASAPAAAPAAPTPAAAAAAVPFAPPTVAAKASSGGRPKDIFDDDDVAKRAAPSVPSVSSSLFGAAPKASAEAEEGKVLSAASAAEPSKPAGGLFEDNEVRSNPLFGTAASAPSTRKPRLDSNEEDAPAPAPAAAPAAPTPAAAAAAVPFAPPTVAAKASSGPSLFGGSGRLAKDIFDDDDDDDVVKQAPVGSSGLFGAPVPPEPAAVVPLQAAEPPALAASPAPAGSGAGGAACASKEASKAAGLFGDSEVRFNPLSGSAPAAAAPAAATLPFAPPLVAAKASSGGPSLFGGSGRLATNIFDDDDDDGFVKQAVPIGSAVSSLLAAAPVAQAAPPDPLAAGDDARKTSGEGQAVASAAPAAEPPKPAAGGLFGDSEVRFNPLSGSAPASSTLRKSSLDSADGDVPAPPPAPPAAPTVPFAPPLVAAKASSGGPSLFGGSGRMATSIFDDDDDDDFVKQAAPSGSTLSSLFGAPPQAAPADPLGALAGPKTEPEPAAEKSSDPLGGKVVFKPPL